MADRFARSEPAFIEGIIIASPVRVAKTIDPVRVRPLPPRVDRRSLCRFSTR